MTERVVIADDEPLARERLRMLLGARDDCAIVAECGDGVSAVTAIVEEAPDIVFLDIRMPGLDGFEVLDAIAAFKTPPAVVFVTAFSEHAVRAFDIGAADYLMKPFDAERLAKALERVASRRERVTAGARELLGSVGTERRYRERFVVRGAKGLYFVAARDLVWIDATSNYVRLHAAGRLHLVRETLGAFADKLDPGEFMRVHRGAVVRIDQVARIEPRGHGRYRLVLSDGTVLTSSRRYGDGIRTLVR